MSTAQSLLAPTIVTGRPRKYQDIGEFQDAITAYFAGRDAIDKPYTMHGLARALDCSRQTLLNYEQYNDAGTFVDAIKSARERVAEWTEDRLHQKGYHPAGAIFSLKNNFGWQDVQRVEMSAQVIALGFQVSDEQRKALVPTVQIAQIPSANGEVVQAGDRPAAGPTFASDASLSPVPRND